MEASAASGVSPQPGFPPGTLHLTTAHRWRDFSGIGVLFFASLSKPQAKVQPVSGLVTLCEGLSMTRAVESG